MKYQQLGDNVLVICYEPDDLEKGPDIVVMHYNYLRTKLDREVRDIVLCYSSIGVYFDNRITSYYDVEDRVRILLSEFSGSGGMTGEEVVIPVFYGGDFGPDLENIARYLNMTTEDVIREHSSKKYKVFGIGFLPGFPYLGPLPEKLVVPRKPIPAARVPAGSVAIAGKQTGIYPCDSPGGWHVIGWSPVKMFDLSLSIPSYLKPGDKVTFMRR